MSHCSMTVSKRTMNATTVKSLFYSPAGLWATGERIRHFLSLNRVFPCAHRTNDRENPVHPVFAGSRPSLKGLSWAVGSNS